MTSSRKVCRLTCSFYLNWEGIFRLLNICEDSSAVLPCVLLYCTSGVTSHLLETERGPQPEIMQTTRHVSRQNGLQESREEPDLEEMKSQFNDVFSLRKPKDAKAGLSSGAKSIGKGVLAGVVGLVAAPVMMAREEGVKGFAKGVGAGVSVHGKNPSQPVQLFICCPIVLQY